MKGGETLHACANTGKILDLFMTVKEFEQISSKENLKKGDVVFLKWKTYEGRTVKCVSRVNEITRGENDSISIRFGYFTFGWDLSSFIKIRKANFLDKLKNKYWGNNLDNDPFMKYGS